MQNYKRKIGMYGEKTRDLQKRLSYERVCLSWKTALVYLYKGNMNEIDPSIHDIDNATFLETQDKAYEATPIEVPVWMPKLESQNGIDLSQYGYVSPISEQYEFKFHIRSFDSDVLGRFIFNGDVLEIPFYEQDGNKAYFKIVDVDRKSEFEDFYVLAKGEVMTDSRESQAFDDQNTNSAIMSDMLDQLEAEAETELPKSGLDTDEYDEYDEEQTDYEPRNKTQSSFLDDPDAEF